jgi:hypothetical protein
LMMETQTHLLVSYLSYSLPLLLPPHVVNIDSRTLSVRRYQQFCSPRWRMVQHVCRVPSRAPGSGQGSQGRCFDGKPRIFGQRATRGARSC